MYINNAFRQKVERRQYERPYGLAKAYIDLPMMTIITYIFMMIIALICAKKTYSKHQLE